VHVLHPLGEEDLRIVLERGRRLLGAPPLDEAATQRLIGYADGDARRLLNTLETVARSVGAATLIDEASLELALGEQLRRYDKGELFYDTVFGIAQGGARLGP